MTDDWAIRWGDREWASSDLTGHHLAAVAEMLNIPPPWEWLNLADLHPSTGPLQLMSLIAAFIVVDEGVRGTAAQRAVLDSIKDATIDDLLGALVLPVSQ